MLVIGVYHSLLCRLLDVVGKRFARIYPDPHPSLLTTHESEMLSPKKTSQVTYVTMVPRVGNETLRPLGVATGNALSVTRSEDTYEKTPPVGRRQPMTSLPAYHNISAAGRIHHQLLRLKLASEAWLKAQGTQCLVPHSGNHGYIRNLRRSPSWELELRPLGVATGNVIPTSPC